jgi:hypothetical protein
MTNKDMLKQAFDAGVSTGKRDATMDYPCLCPQCTEELAGLINLEGITVAFGQCPRCKKMDTVIPMSDIRRGLWD